MPQLALLRTGGAGDGDSTVNGIITISSNTAWSAGNYDCSGLDIVVENGVTLTLNGDTGAGTGVTITADDVTVDGTISANGKGYPGCFTSCTSGTNGPGRGDYQEGGSYGGIGGRSSIDRIYGTYNNPTQLGSGGGGGGGSTTGTAGGGAVVLTVDSLDVDGTITANGVDNSGTASTGSGGTIKATISGNFSGTGSFSADGGGKPSNSQGGTGGGGRIYISYTGTDTFSAAGSGSGTLSVEGGDNSGGAVGGLSGSAILYDSTNQDYFIVANTRVYAEKSDPNFSGRNFKILNSSTLYIYGDASANSTVTMTFTNLFTVESGSTISANGKGYQPCFSVGVAACGPGWGGYQKGGSYGGIGGNSSASYLYGSSTQPSDLGSGGGGGTSSQTGSYGGGAIRINGTGATVTINGTVTANGEDRATNGGNGSGGSIWITASNFQGSTGVLSAEGGTGGNYGGGGGRISVQYTSSYTYSGTTSVAGGSGSVQSGGGGSSTSLITQTTTVGTMTRHKVSTASDHTIIFGSSGVDDPSDTIVITFEVGFDLSSITISDVDLEISGSDETLAASPAAGVWGYSKSGQVITFTAPTNATSGEAEANEQITVKIGTVADGGSNQIVNPSTPGSYEISISGSQFELDVPIMDDDQVTISASVDTFITFDLDTPAGSGGSHSETAASYSVDLQVLSFSSVTSEGTTSVTEIYLDLATNADDGATVDVLSANGATGLSSASSGDAIPSATTTLAINTTNGGYGLAADEEAAASEGTLTEVSPFNVFGVTGGVGGLTTSFQTIFNTGTAPIVAGDGVVAVRAVAGKSTSAADDYTDTLTFRATATY